jgi:hypothetical protein
MTELTDDEKLQIQLSIEFVSGVIMPLLDHQEDMLERIADGCDCEFTGSPHFDTMMCCIHALVERGWSAEELLTQVRHHAEAREREKASRVVN